MNLSEIVKEKKLICRFGSKEQEDLSKIFNDNKNDREIRNNTERDKVPSKLLELWKAYFVNNKGKLKKEKVNYPTYDENILKFYKNFCLDDDKNTNTNTNTNTNANISSKRTENRRDAENKRKQEDEDNEKERKRQALENESVQIGTMVTDVNKRFDVLMKDGLIYMDDYEVAKTLFDDINNIRSSCFSKLNDATMNKYYCHLFDKMTIIAQNCIELDWAIEFKNQSKTVKPTIPSISAVSLTSSASSSSISKVPVTNDRAKLLKNIRNRRHDRMNTIYNKVVELTGIVDQKNKLKEDIKDVTSSLKTKSVVKGFDNLENKIIKEIEILDTFDDLINKLKNYRLLQQTNDFIDNKSSFFGVLLDPNNAPRNLIICDNSDSIFEKNILKKIGMVIEENFSNGQVRRTTNIRKLFFSNKKTLIQNENINENLNNNANSDSDSDSDSN